MTIHPNVGSVTTVRCLITRAGVTSHYNADLIFVAGVPTVVIDWIVTPNGDLPGATVALPDRTRLHKIGWPEAEYMYEDPIEDPRRFD